MLAPRSLVWVLVCATLLVTSASGWAAPGDLDPTFGSGGIVITDLGNWEDVPVLALQADGKLVAASSTLILEFPYPEAQALPDMAVVRYNDDGTIDGTFGTGGVVKTHEGFYTYEDSEAILIQPDDKIVVGGGTILVRYEPDGTLDTTFGGGDGIVHASVTDLVLQPDDKIVATGVVTNPGNYYDFKLARYNSDGSLDPTFGTGGVVTTAIGSGYEVPFALVLQPDGKLVAGGYTETPQHKFALVRYESDGSLDPTFGTGGIVVGPDGSYNIEDLLLQPDGKLVASGMISGQFGLVRYNDDGSLDPTFGDGGIVTAPVGGVARSIVLQSNGKIIAVGGEGGPHPATVIVYNPDGTQDPTFGSYGVVTIPLPYGGYANAVVQQPDVKVVVAGLAYNSGGSFEDDFFLARYEGPGAPIVIPSPSPTSTAATPTVSPTPTISPTPPCAATPLSGCIEPFRPEKSQLLLKDRTPDDKDKLLWKWSYGPPTELADFEDPMLFTNYALCVYDRVAGLPTLVLGAKIPSNTESGPCSGKSCWRVINGGFKYRNKDATPNGIATVVLKSGYGVVGKGKIKVAGKGLNLPMPSLPLAQSSTVTAQLVNSAGNCWAADYPTPALVNTMEQFRDRSD